MNYYILKQRNLQDLQEEVNGYMDDGWIPTGGLLHLNGVFYQAMMKVKKA